MKTINEKLAKRKARLKRVYSEAKFRKHFPTVEYYVEQQKNSNSKTQRQQNATREYIHGLLASWHVEADAPKKKTSKNIEKILEYLLTWVR